MYALQSKCKKLSPNYQTFISQACEIPLKVRQRIEDRIKRLNLLSKKTAIVLNLSKNNITI